MPISYDGKDWDFADLVEHIKKTKPEIDSPGGYVKRIEDAQNGKECKKCGGRTVSIENQGLDISVCTSCHGMRVTENSKESFVTAQSFINQHVGYLKKKYGREAAFMYGLAKNTKDKKIKGTLAYAGASLNGRVYLPEELAKGDGMTVPLLVNHGSTMGAEAELDRLPNQYRTGLEAGKEIKVGEVTLHWNPDKLTLFYEGRISDPFFQKEVGEANMAVSLGILYDVDSPEICNESCYTIIKGTEFREVSLVYHPGFPIATIEAAEACIKKTALEFSTSPYKPVVMEDAGGAPDTMKVGKPSELNKMKSEPEEQKPQKPQFVSGEDDHNGSHTKVHDAVKDKTESPWALSNWIVRKNDMESCKICNSSFKSTESAVDHLWSFHRVEEALLYVGHPGEDDKGTVSKIIDNADNLQKKTEEAGEPIIEDKKGKVFAFDDKKDPNINVLNTYKHENGKDRMTSRTAEEAQSAYQIQPEGDLPAKVVPENGAGGSSGGGNCPDGKVWNAHTEKCEDSDVGNATKRGPSPPVKKVSVSPDGEEAYRARRARETGQMHTDNPEEDGLPEGGKVDIGLPPHIGKANADLASERKRTEEYLKKLQVLEAMDQLKVEEARVKAKELLAREKEADARLRKAKELAKPRAIIQGKPGAIEASGKTSAIESEVAKPVSWSQAVVRGHNVAGQFVYTLNKERVFENYPNTYRKYFEGDIERRLPIGAKIPGTETVSGPPTASNMLVMSEQVLVLPNSTVVTPIRQFADTKILPPGTYQGYFFDFGNVTFSPITEDGSTQVSESSLNIRAAGTNASPRGTRLTIGYTQLETSPIDIIAAANRAFALAAISDEAVQVLTTAYNTDTGSSGDGTNIKAIGGGAKTGRWINGNTGAQITADSSGLGNMTYQGLLASKGVIQDYGLDDSNLVMYTTGRSIRNLSLDPDLDTYIGYSRPAIITEGTVERLSGISLVRSDTALADTSQSGGARSVLFIPNVAFGIITGRDLTMEAQRRNELQSIFLTGAQRIAGVVKEVEATVRVSAL